MKMIEVTEKEVSIRALNIAELIKSQYGNKTVLYGVPNGGSHAVIRVSESLHFLDVEHSITANPDCATIFIDDIIDSGKTRNRLKDQYPFIDFYALYHSVAEEGFIRFPWESQHGGMEDQIVRILEYIGEDPNRDGLKDTPKRVIRMWDELFKGYKQDPKKLVTIFDNDEGYDEMIILKDIPYFSMCEHHMLPFFGHTHIAYIPGELEENPSNPKTSKIIGISKLARIVDCYSRRLQVQERMTQQISQAIEEAISPSGVAVFVEGQHLCMQMRGVQKPGATMVTSSLKGLMKQQEARMEFLLLSK